MFCAALLLRWLRHGLALRPFDIVVDRGLRVRVEAVAGGVHTRKQSRKTTRVGRWVRRRTQAVGGPADGAQVRGWWVGKWEEEAGRLV